MEHLISKSKSKGSNRDEEEVDAQPKALAEMIEATKECRVKIASARYHWDCVVLESLSTDTWVETLNKWADLAYKGDWEGLLRMGVKWANLAYKGDSEGLGIGLKWPVLINSRRLQNRIGPGGAHARPSAGFTALHQAAWHGAPVEIVQALINATSGPTSVPSLGWERTTNGKSQLPIDVARSKGHTNPELLELLEPPNLLPRWSQEDLQAVEKNFHDIIKRRLNGAAEDEQLRLPNLEILRELGEGVKVGMRVPGVMGGFGFWIEGDHLVSESSFQIMGCSGMTYRITPKEATLVDSGWG